jgi:hypothetical protein
LDEESRANLIELVLASAESHSVKADMNFSLIASRLTDAGGAGSGERGELIDLTLGYWIRYLSDKTADTRLAQLLNIVQSLSR